MNPVAMTISPIFGNKFTKQAWGQTNDTLTQFLLFKNLGKNFFENIARKGENAVY